MLGPDDKITAYVEASSRKRIQDATIVRNLAYREKLQKPRPRNMVSLQRKSTRNIESIKQSTKIVILIQMSVWLLLMHCR